MTNNELLDILYKLTLIESKRELTSKEESNYIKIVEHLQKSNIVIPFGIIL